jgi:Na+/glutamate symporter
MLSSPGPLLRVTSTLGINYVLTRAVTRGMKEDETLQVLTTSNALVGGTGTAVQMATAWEGGSGGVGLKRVAVGVGTFGYISGCVLAEVWEVLINRLGFNL